MENRKILNLPPVAHTLLVPLACRVHESASINTQMHDPRAMDLFTCLEGGLNCLRAISDFDQVVTVMRARQFDRYARAFLSAIPQGSVIDIGCGLDTHFDRLDNGQMTWLGLDLPEVVELGHRYLPDTERCQTLACSMFDLPWLDVVAQLNKPAIFLAGGVFPYFIEAEVKGVVIALAERFSGAEPVFDALSPLTAGILNHTSTILKETGARVNWAVGDAHQFESWGLYLLDKWGYFDCHEPCLGTFNLLHFIPPDANANYVLRYGLERKR